MNQDRLDELSALDAAGTLRVRVNSILCSYTSATWRTRAAELAWR